MGLTIPRVYKIKFIPSTSTICTYVELDTHTRRRSMGYDGPSLLYCRHGSMKDTMNG